MLQPVYKWEGYHAQRYQPVAEKIMLFNGDHRTTESVRKNFEVSQGRAHGVKIGPHIECAFATSTRLY